MLQACNASFFRQIDYWDISGEQKFSVGDGNCVRESGLFSIPFADRRLLLLTHFILRKLGWEELAFFEERLEAYPAPMKCSTCFLIQISKQIAGRVPLNPFSNQIHCHHTHFPKSPRNSRTVVLPIMESLRECCDKLMPSQSQ
jgi:hypothetical protein